MRENIQLEDISILVTRKAIKHVHLSVYPPSGRVTLVAPVGTHFDVARATRSRGWPGFASSNRNSGAKPVKLLASSSNAKAIACGGDDTSLPSCIGKPNRSFRSTIGASRSQCAQAMMLKSAPR